MVTGEHGSGGLGGPPLDPGRVGDCYLGLLLPAPTGGEPEAPRVLVVAPDALLQPAVPQPAGGLLHRLLTGHPERQPGELVFPGDLAVELRAWPAADLGGSDLDRVAAAVIGCWQAGEVKGLVFEGLGFAEARAVVSPQLRALRGQVRGRLAAQIARAYRRWLHPTSGRRPGERFL